MSDQVGDKNATSSPQKQKTKKGELDADNLQEVIGTIKNVFESSKTVKDFPRKLGQVKVKEKRLSWGLFLKYSKGLNQKSFVLQHVLRLYQEARRFMGLFNIYFESESSPVLVCRILHRGAVKGAIQSCKTMGYGQCTLHQLTPWGEDQLLYPNWVICVGSALVCPNQEPSQQRLAAETAMSTILFPEDSSKILPSCVYSMVCDLFHDDP